MAPPSEEERGLKRTESVGEADRRTAVMEGATEEEYKEKLLWSVKREVGAAPSGPPGDLRCAQPAFY